MVYQCRSSPNNSLELGTLKVAVAAGDVFSQRASRPHADQKQREGSPRDFATCCHV